MAWPSSFTRLGNFSRRPFDAIALEASVSRALVLAAIQGPRAALAQLAVLVMMEAMRVQSKLAPVGVGHESPKASMVVLAPGGRLIREQLLDPTSEHQITRRCHMSSPKPSLHEALERDGQNRESTPHNIQRVCIGARSMRLS